MQEYIALHSNHRFINMFYQENTEKARSYEEFLLACNMSKHFESILTPDNFLHNNKRPISSQNFKKKKNRTRGCPSPK